MAACSFARSDTENISLAAAAAAGAGKYSSFSFSQKMMGREKDRELQR